jgi:hypothetical protein
MGATWRPAERGNSVETTFFWGSGLRAHRRSDSGGLPCFCGDGMYERRRVRVDPRVKRVMALLDLKFSGPPLYPIGAKTQVRSSGPMV